MENFVIFATWIANMSANAEATLDVDLRVISLSAERSFHLTKPN